MWILCKYLLSLQGFPTYLYFIERSINFLPKKYFYKFWKLVFIYFYFNFHFHISEKRTQKIHVYRSWHFDILCAQTRTFMQTKSSGWKLVSWGVAWVLCDKTEKLNKHLRIDKGFVQFRASYFYISYIFSTYSLYDLEKVTSTDPVSSLK